MSNGSDQALREIANVLRSIDDSLKTIAKNTQRTRWTNHEEGANSGATVGADRTARGDDYVGPYGSGPEPYS